MSTTHRAVRPAANAMRHSDGASDQVRGRRAVWLLLLTLVLPGSAQLVAGNRRLGRLGLRVWLAVVLTLATLLGVAWLDRGVVLSLLTRTVVLWVLLAVLLALAVGWFVLFLDAWRLASPSRLPGGTARAVSVLTVVLVVLTSGPLLYGGYLVSAQRSLIASVFSSGVQADPVDGRYNVLLIGGDAGEGRIGLRADSMNVASIDADTGAVVQVGIPRNLVGAPFPDGSPMAERFPDGFDEFDGYTNAVYTYGQQNPDLYPGAVDPGAEALKDAVEGVTGLQVQYYALVDMQGFERLVDALGGVELDVKVRVPRASVNEAEATSFIEPGVQRLDGADALWFARSRFDSTDYDRMARQRCVMAAVLAQVEPQTVILRFKDIAVASAGLLSTDLPEADLGGFADLALKARAQPVTTVELVPPMIDTGDPDFDLTRQLVTDAVSVSQEQVSEAPPDDVPVEPAPQAAPDATAPQDGPPPEEPAEPAPPAPGGLSEICAAV